MARLPLHKLAYLLQRQSFCVLHGDIHSPAASHPLPPFHTGSCRIGKDFFVRARPALEMTRRLRLITHWIILIDKLKLVPRYNEE